jgi:hypothetical protein
MLMASGESPGANYVIGTGGLLILLAVIIGVPEKGDDASVPDKR